MAVAFVSTVPKIAGARRDRAARRRAVAPRRPALGPALAGRRGGVDAARQPRRAPADRRPAPDGVLGRRAHRLPAARRRRRSPRPGSAAAVFYAVAYAMPVDGDHARRRRGGRRARRLRRARRSAARATAWAIVRHAASRSSASRRSSGFFGKLYLFAAALAARARGASVVLAVVMSVVSAGYYFRIVRAMFFAEAPAGHVGVARSAAAATAVAACVVADGRRWASRRGPLLAVARRRAALGSRPARLCAFCVRARKPLASRQYRCSEVPGQTHTLMNSRCTRCLTSRPIDSPWSSAGAAGQRCSASTTSGEQPPPGVPASPGRPPSPTPTPPSPPPWMAGARRAPRRARGCDAGRADLRSSRSRCATTPARTTRPARSRRRQKRWSSAAVVTAASLGALVGGLLVAAALLVWAFGLMPGRATADAAGRREPARSVRRQTIIDHARQRRTSRSPRPSPRRSCPRSSTSTIQQAGVDPFTGARRSAGRRQRLRRHHPLGRLHPHQQPRRRGRRPRSSSRSASRTRPPRSSAPTRPPTSRSSRSTAPAIPAIEVGSSKDLQGRAVRHGGRQPVRPRQDGHDRHHLGAAPLGAGAGPDRQRHHHLHEPHPDRRGHQPGQLGRRARRRRRAGSSASTRSSSRPRAAWARRSRRASASRSRSTSPSTSPTSSSRPARRRHPYLGRRRPQTVDESVAAQFGLPVKSGALVRFVQPGVARRDRPASSAATSSSRSATRAITQRRGRLRGDPRAQDRRDRRRSRSCAATQAHASTSTLGLGRGRAVKHHHRRRRPPQGALLARGGRRVPQAAAALRRRARRRGRRPRLRPRRRARALAEEGADVLRALPAGAHVVALEIGGRAALERGVLGAARRRSALDGSQPASSFVIGGSRGLVARRARARRRAAVARADDAAAPARARACCSSSSTARSASAAASRTTSRASLCRGALRRHRGILCRSHPDPMHGGPDTVRDAHLAARHRTRSPSAIAAGELPLAELPDRRARASARPGARRLGDDRRAALAPRPRA